MPFQNAPANVVCGAKILRDEMIVVRHNKKSGVKFFNVNGTHRIFLLIPERDEI
jgi:hypothetical protein